jgi:hypothetical protein
MWVLAAGAAVLVLVAVWLGSEAPEGESEAGALRPGTPPWALRPAEPVQAVSAARGLCPSIPLGALRPPDPPRLGSMDTVKVGAAALLVATPGLWLWWQRRSRSWVDLAVVGLAGYLLWRLFRDAD